MNIAFDGLFLTEYGRGICDFSLSLCNKMINSNSDNNYFLFNFLNTYETNFKFKNFTEICFDGLNAEIIRNNNKIYGEILTKYLKDYKIDIYIILSPFNNVIFCYEKKWFGKCYVYAILYDAIPYVFKYHYLKQIVNYNSYLRLVNSIRQFDGYGAISESTKKDFIKYFNFDKNKFSSAYCFRLREFYRCPSFIDLKKRFNIFNPYFIYVSGDEFRKNNINIIKAFNLFLKKKKKNYNLVLVGKFSASSILCLKEHDLSNRVIFSGFVTDEELNYLIKNASYGLYVSLYEGFGLPILDFFHYKIPFMTSNNSSMVEIGGDKCIYVNPSKIKSIAEGFSKLDNKEYDLSFESDYEKRESFYSSESSAKNVLHFLKLDGNKKRIAIFTPLPPIKSGIADHSIELIKHLSNYYDVDVIIDDYIPNVRFEEGVKIINHNNFQNLYHKIIYEFGNSEYHLYMIKYIYKFNGIIELHDCKINDLENYAKSNYELLSSKYNWHFDKNELDTANNFFYKIFEKSESIIVVHNKWSRGFLSKLVNNDIVIVPCFTFRQKFIDKKTARERVGIKQKSYVFTTFGFAHKSKMVFQLFLAFLIFSLKNKNNDMKLLFCGSDIYLDKELKDKISFFIKKYNMEDKVFFTGYLNSEIYNLYLHASDINFQLREHESYHGESSGAVLRSLSAGIPCVVSKIGYFDEIHDDCCIKIQNLEEDSLYSEVKNIIDCFNLVIEKEKLNKISKKEKMYSKKYLCPKVIYLYLNLLK